LLSSSRSLSPLAHIAADWPAEARRGVAQAEETLTHRKERGSGLAGRDWGARLAWWFWDECLAPVHWSDLARDAAEKKCAI